MHKLLVVLAILGTGAAPALAQTPAAPQAPVANQMQPAKPVMVKKRVCYQAEEDSYSRLGGRKICKTVEVQAEPNAPANQQPKQAPQGAAPNSGL